MNLYSALYISPLSLKRLDMVDCRKGKTDYHFNPFIRLSSSRVPIVFSFPEVSTVPWIFRSLEL